MTSSKLFPAPFIGLMRANKIKKFTVDLSSARTDVSLVGEGLIPSKTFMALTILNKGTGTFSFKLHFYDSTNSESFSQDEVLNGDVFEVEFKDLIFTNVAQAGLTAVFIASWREV